MQSRTLERSHWRLLWIAKCCAGVRSLAGGVLGYKPGERWRRAIRVANLDPRRK